MSGSDLLVAHVDAEQPRVGARAPRVALAVLHDRVAGHDHQGMGDRRPHHLLGDGEHRHHPALLPTFGEGLGGEPLAGGRPQQVRVVDAEGLAPSLVEHARRDVGHARGVRVTLGGDVEAAGARAVDHRQVPRRGRRRWCCAGAPRAAARR